MTSTTDTDGHPEVAEISALTEGILPLERSALLRDHLEDCDLCTDVRRSLDEIRALLGTLPGPVRMPADVAGRIDAALAAEALISTTAAAVAPAAASHDSPALPGSAVSRETSPARRRPGGRSSASTGPGRAQGRRRWTRALLVAACAAVAFTGGSMVIHSFTPQGTGTTPSATPTSRIDAFSGMEVPVRVHQLMATASPRTGAQATQGNPMHLDMATVPACVLHGTGRTGEPLASTRGRYDNRDAYLLVLPHPSDPSRVDAFIVDASCDSGPSPAPGRLLAEQTYRRD